MQLISYVVSEKNAGNVMDRVAKQAVLNNAKT